MAQSKSTQVAKKEEDGGVPDYLKNYEGEAGGEDNFDSSDLVIPQVKLLQGTSEEVNQFNEAKAGEFWHTGMDKLLGGEIEFVVCQRRKRYMLSPPLIDGRGPLARADDAKTWDRTGKWEVQIDKKTKATWEITDRDVAKSGLAEWGTFDPTDENSPPAATLFYEYLVVLPGFPDLGPAVILLARSAIKRARKGLNDKIALHQSNGRPMQAIRFKATSYVDTNDVGQEFSNWAFTGAGFADESTFNWARRIADSIGLYRVQDEGTPDPAMEPGRSAGDDEDTEY